MAWSLLGLGSYGIRDAPPMIHGLDLAAIVTVSRGIVTAKPPWFTYVLPGLPRIRVKQQKRSFLSPQDCLATHSHPQASQC